MNEEEKTGVLPAEETGAEETDGTLIAGTVTEDGEAAAEPEEETDTEDPVSGDQPEEEAAAEPLPAEPVEVIGVRFKKQGKIYYFDPVGVKAAKNDHVIVDTSRGQEYGLVALGNRMVNGNEIVPPLRKTVRLATAEDDAHYQENLRRETDAFNVCLEQIELHQLGMKLVDVEYTFDNSKLLFYYTADGRVDFRELVKHLASVFRTRIEMRQIGIRDEAKMMGGLGVCGRPYCCASFLNDFVQVSIKMAKEQNLSLNSAKISGACGRLMCCLRYEYETYQAEAAITPKVDAVVDTPDGQGLVVEANPLCGMCKVMMLNAIGQPPKTFLRDDLKPTGQMKRDLPPEVLHPTPDPEEAARRADRRAERRSLRPRPENKPVRAKSFEEAEALRTEAMEAEKNAKAERNRKNAEERTDTEGTAPAVPEEIPAGTAAEEIPAASEAKTQTDSAGEGRKNDGHRYRGGRKHPRGGQRRPGNGERSGSGDRSGNGERNGKDGNGAPRGDRAANASGKKPDRPSGKTGEN